MRLRHDAGVFWGWEERIPRPGEGASRDGTPRSPPALSTRCFGTPKIPPRPTSGCGTAPCREPLALPACTGAEPGGGLCCSKQIFENSVVFGLFFFFARIIFTPGWRRLGSAGRAEPRRSPASSPCCFWERVVQTQRPPQRRVGLPASPCPVPSGNPLCRPSAGCGSPSKRGVPVRAPNLTAVRPLLRWAGGAGREGNGIGLT